MLSSPSLSSVTILYVVTFVSSKFDHVVYIDNQNGSNTEECFLSYNESLACRDLDWVLQQPLSRRNSTQFILAEGIHEIQNNSAQFKELSQLEFMGKNSTIVCTDAGIGLAFICIQDISFYNLKISNCSSLHYSSSRNIYLENVSEEVSQFYAALYFAMCQNLILNNVEIQETPSGTAVVIYNVVGRNVITNSLFGKNNIDRHPGGGGFIVGFTSSLPEYVSCFENITSDNSPKYFNSNGYYLFENVTFYNNSAGNGTSFSQDKNNYTPYKAMQSIFGKGGGLALFVKGNASHNQVILRNCDFINNRAVRGSGFLVEFQDLASNNTVVIENCLFLGNGIADPQLIHSAGGGLMIGHYIYGNAYSILRNTLKVINCNFTSNRAYNGGGMSIIPARINTDSTENVFSIIIQKSHFTENVAQLGAALEVTLFSLFVYGQLSTIVIDSSTFTSNSIYFKSTFSINEDGIGSVYTNSVPIQFKRNILFQDNKGSALAMVGTKVDFTNCNASFIGNTGRYGGGINILGSAFLLVNKNTTLTFINNLAHIRGGAISNTFMERENFKMYPNCFVRYIDPFSAPDNWNAKFIFINNHAISLGPSIYTTSVLPCTWVGGSGQQRPEDIFYWKGWSYYRNNTLLNDTEEIATSVGKIEYINKTSINKDNVFTVKSIPGQKIKLPLQIEDDLHHSNVANSSTFMARFVLNDSANVSSSHTFVTGTRKLLIWGHENSQIRVALDTISERSWHVELDLHLMECPPGYFITSNLSCSCLNQQWGPLIQCFPNFEASIKNGYWIGKTEDGNVEVSLCPLSYCNQNETNGIYYNISSKYPKLTESLCGGSKHRQGILCGLCKENYGVSVTTENLVCIPCNDTHIASNIVKYIFAVHFPLLILFAFLLIFQVRLSSGPANSFIFYAQTISTTSLLTADRHLYVDVYIRNKPKFTKLYEVVYGIFNLRVAENTVNPLCINTKLNALDAFQLSYLVALFPVLLILALILFMRIKNCSKIRQCCGRCMWKLSLFRYLRKWNIGDGLLHVFSAFLVLSYTRWTLSSFFILHSTKTSRAFYAGQYKTSDSQYIWRYKVPALLVILTSFLLPIALFNYPILWLEKCINRIKWLSKLYPKDKVHIILDNFQGCYRDNRRYFAGIYFLFRMLMGAASILGSDWFRQYTVQQFLITIMLLMVAILRPYRKEFWYLNPIDLLMFTNLAVVNGLSLYKLSFNVFYNSKRSGFKRMLYSQLVLLYLPIVCMVLYLMWKLIPESYKKHMKKFIHGLALKSKKVKSRLLYGVQVPTSATQEELDSEQDHLVTSTSSVNNYNSKSSSVEVSHGYRQNYVITRTQDNTNVSRSEIKDESAYDQIKSPTPDNEEGRARVNEMSSLAKISSSVSKRPTYGLL